MNRAYNITAKLSYIASKKHKEVLIWHFQHQWSKPLGVGLRVIVSAVGAHMIIRMSDATSSWCGLTGVAKIAAHGKRTTSIATAQIRCLIVKSFVGVVTKKPSRTALG